jgi:3-oxoacyl-[acyl-carrier-protein] synthase-3
MNKKIYSIIVGTGSYIPTKRVPNEAFLESTFYGPDGKVLDKTNAEIIDKFEKITGIKERRYVTDDLLASDIAYFAAQDALESSKIDPETLDYIIFAHNFADIKADNRRSDFVPSLAARVKHKLQIVNPYTIAHDTPFGCPGWVQGMTQADYYIRSGDAKRVLVMGAETLSRIADPHDRDGMIYADGAGATILEALTSEEPVGILSHAARSDTLEYAYMLWMDRSNNPKYKESNLFLKMHGHKLYEYALKNVPQVVKQSLDMAGLSINDVNKVLIHQANGKMDDAILERLFGLYGVKEIPPDVMPMSIAWLGNSSVATIPTLLDLVCKEKIENHAWEKGHIIVLTSVGAGMNINSMVYKIP